MHMSLDLKKVLKMNKEQLIIEFNQLRDKWKDYEATSQRMEEVHQLLLKLEEPTKELKD